MVNSFGLDYNQSYLVFLSFSFGAVLSNSPVLVWQNKINF
jgi:hypothetical protein